MIQFYIIPVAAIILLVWCACQIRFRNYVRNRYLLGFVCGLITVLVFPLAFFAEKNVFLMHFVNMVITLALSWILYRLCCWIKIRRRYSRYVNELKRVSK